MSVPKTLIKNLSHIDHRNIGQRQGLFFLDKFSKGSSFFLPRGTHIYNKLTSYLREQYKAHGYQEVKTPNIYDSRLWKISGHWEHYEDHMIKFKLGQKDFSLKPMNCPGHCLMYKHLGKIHSSQLPIRWADFGALHRNEASGALLGLSRLRRFQQDDAHIFCTPDQVESEVTNCLKMAEEIYGQFDFKFNIALSLRPQKYLGDDELWDRAEDSLRKALVNSKLDFEEQKFDGAFYGPKIDLTIKDCHQRLQQCATIQLDFQLPQRFDLTYRHQSDTSCLERPVIIHRAIFGSIERFIAMLAEHTSGRWPFWMSPLQAKVIPVHDKFISYATKIHERLVREGFMADCELDPHSTLSKKVQSAEFTRYNFILVVGRGEEETESVNVRFNVEKEARQHSVSVDRLVELFKEFERKKVKNAEKELLLTLTV